MVGNARNAGVAANQASQKEECNLDGSVGVVRWDNTEDAILRSDLGTSDQRVVSGDLEYIGKLTDGRIHCLILPAEFTGLEREAYERRRHQA